jgi:SMODS and SLOG-associating 2TM effector domain family 5
MKSFLIDLRTKAWRTAGARYNASRRLKRREWVSTTSLALLSALSIAVAYSQKVYAKGGTSLDDYLSVVAMGIGVLLLVTSLLEWGAGYGVRAAELFKNAELLTNYQLKVAQTLQAMESGGAVTLQEVDSLRLEYETVKDRCTTNHQPIDDALFRAQKRADPALRVGQKDDGALQMNWLVAQAVKVAWHASEIWFFVFVWALVLCSIAYAFCLANASGGTPPAVC